jgi:hypothetical protein
VHELQLKLHVCILDRSNMVRLWLEIHTKLVSVHPPLQTDNSVIMLVEAPKVFVSRILVLSE